MLGAVDHGGLIPEAVMDKIWDILKTPLPLTEIIGTDTCKAERKLPMKRIKVTTRGRDTGELGPGDTLANQVLRRHYGSGDRKAQTAAIKSLIGG